jgi:predicted Fe-S protein YdhL (DUF1289 family)
MLAQSDDPLASPCIRRCCLDDDDVCMGCGRSLEEIMVWSHSSDEDKAAILARSRQRALAKARRGAS